MKNKKLKATLSLTGYLFLTIALCFVAAFIFHSYYYDLIYVDGASMAPTLNGDTANEVDFGIVDGHQSAINHIKRFDIISTYYPYSAGYDKDYTATGVLKKSSTKKIKRVIAMPNETFKIENGLLKLRKNDGSELKVEYKNFQVVETDSKDELEWITLGEDEYWVLGDNRPHSTDCGSEQIKKPIKKKNIVGVLVAIEGKAKLTTKSKTCANCFNQNNKDNTVCSYCGSDNLTPNYSLTNKHYHWPKFF